ncbi:putative aldose reductase-related protein 1-like [Apostichopus japonicus]|uniref:Putative aldose reductase-related protein 1-like n=1 Tax=Stichopus japonicus TaxID=307972 RepID=A0A2G8K404_STIJA|nr:putative aldose reductase-related protein 1-like [Apostichopus japonicus]
MAMEKLVEKGLAISIGVSNFNVSQMEEIVTAAQVPCVMNQIEIHPAIDQSDIITYCKAKSIALTHTAFGSPTDLGYLNENIPLLKTIDINDWASDKDPNLFEDPVVKEIAESRGCTAGQVLLAYHLNQEIVVVPKSVTPSRIKENFEALSIKLKPEEITKLKELNSTNYRACAMNMLKDHPYFPFK